MKHSTFKKIAMQEMDGDFLYARLFFEKISTTPLGSVWEILNLPYEAEISKEIDKSQIFDAVAFRNVYRARRISLYLIDNEGKFHQDRLDTLIKELERGRFLPYSHNLGENLFMEHLFRALKSLRGKKNAFMEFKVPVCHHFMEKILRGALQIEENKALTNSDVRRAVLSALLVSLRQNVGSCFATAPAILIQLEQPENLLQDLSDLIHTGMMKRVIEGIEYSVPLSPRLGTAELKKPYFISSSTFSPILKQVFEKFNLPFPKAFPLGFSVERLLKNALVAKFKIKQSDIEVLEKGASLSLRQMAHIDNHVELAREIFENAKMKILSFIEHPLLKAWEFTLASLSDYKVDFFKWNLAASLGFDHKEKGGLGEVIYQTIDQKLKENNRILEKHQKEAERASDQVRVAESLLSNASSYDQVRRLKAELAAHIHHREAHLDLRDESYAISKALSQFYSFLLQQYQLKFKEYFQEIYDPSMHDVDAKLFEDSPAGFRLVYKHGRKDPSLWTVIEDEKQYIDALVNFFVSIEASIIDNCPWESGMKEIPGITTAIIHHLRTPEFLHSAYLRMAKLHQMPIKEPVFDHKHLEKKPWSYTSGGDMKTLLHCYFHAEKEFSEEKRFVESEMDLLTFLMDLLKSVPFFLEEEFEKNPQKGMLMYSPSHAFLLKPGIAFFKNGWEQNALSYTWARDEALAPQREFYNAMKIYPSSQQMLIHHFFKEHSIFLKKSGRKKTDIEVSPAEFKEYLKSEIEYIERFSASFIEERVDGFLRKSLPCFSPYGIKEKIHRILSIFFGREINSSILDPINIEEEIPFKTFYEILRALIYKAHEKIAFPFDMDEKLIGILRDLKWAPPSPVIFADTNWMKYYFAFTFNPASECFELWRMDYLGIEGMPMSTWKAFFNGQNKLPWGVFTRPKEYSNIRLASSAFFHKKV